jgi:hypothetical protein
MKKNQSDLVFAPLKVKKVIQDNKEIGKVANMTPYVISKSLEYFMKDLINDACVISKECKNNIITPEHLKAAIIKNESLSFLIKEIQQENDTLLKKKHSNNEKGIKSTNKKKQKELKYEEDDSNNDFE